MSVLSYREQALRYLTRPHEAPPGEPRQGPDAWRGPALTLSDDWVETLSPAEIDELEVAIARVRARGLKLHEVGASEFELPTLSVRMADWTRELRDGRGLLLVRGLPVERWGDEDSALAYWGIGQHLGEPGAQNPAGELLGHVVDTGEEASDPFVRRYRTAGDIAYHCDLADVVGLLCLRQAPSGGGSRVVSSVSVHDELLRTAPELVARLYEPFFLDRRGEHKPDEAPALPVPPCRFDGVKLRTFWHSDYMRSAPRHSSVPDFTAHELAVIDRYEEIANNPEFYLDMALRPGDIQLLSNHVVLHARTAYEDSSDPKAKRHLLRLWLSL